MAELQPGNPDELVRTLRNWLREAHDPVGSLPAGTDPVEWAVRRFIESWAKPVRDSIRLLEEWLADADRLLAAGDVAAARDTLDSVRQLVQESLRSELGVYP